MSIIIPAILTNSINDFIDKLKLVESFPGVSSIHIDFADNKFVQNQTLLPDRIPSLPLKYVFGAHLMVEDPSLYFTDLQKAGFEVVAFHIESFTETDKAIDFIGQAKNLGLAAHVAINPGTSIEKLRPLLNEIDGIQVMGVEPGFYGSEYIEQAERIRFLRNQDFYGTISVDGGIDKKKALPLLSAGADRLIVGSAIFKSNDPRSAFIELTKEVGEMV